jgi:hypothetical protein
MSSLLLPARYIQQPQQFVPLDRRTRIGAGALAVVTPTIDVNWATGKQLTRGAASAYNVAPLGGLQTFNFRKNFYLETETLPAVGANPYVMFWLGWPVATGAVLGPNEPAFVVGSSNNSLGICISVGSARAIGNGPAAATTWGGSNNTWTSIWSAYDTLAMGTTGAPVLLMMVRKSTGLEFWRNGVLVNTVAGSPTNVAAFKMEIGSFIASTNWESSSNTALAGLSILNSDPVDAELLDFAANPLGTLWSAPQRRLWASASAAAGAVLDGAASGAASATGALSTSISLAGAANAQASGTGALTTSVRLAGSAVAQANGSGTIPGGAASLVGSAITAASGSATLSTSVLMAGAASAQASAAAALTTSISLAGAAVAQASAANLSMSPAPRVYAATIMRITTTNRRADLGAVLNVAAPIRSTGLNVATILSAAPVNRAADLGPVTLNRTVRFP